MNPDTNRGYAIIHPDDVADSYADSKVPRRVSPPDRRARWRPARCHSHPDPRPLRLRAGHRLPPRETEEVYLVTAGRGRCPSSRHRDGARARRGRRLAPATIGSGQFANAIAPRQDLCVLDFEYIRSRGAHGHHAVGSFDAFVGCEREISIGSDGSGLIRERRGPVSFFTEAGRSRWQAGGSPGLEAARALICSRPASLAGAGSCVRGSIVIPRGWRRRSGNTRPP